MGAPGGLHSQPSLVVFRTASQQLDGEQYLVGNMIARVVRFSVMLLLDYVLGLL